MPQDGWANADSKVAGNKASALRLAPVADQRGRVMYAADARSMFIGAVRGIDILVMIASAMLAYRLRDGSYGLRHEYLVQVAIGCLVAASALGWTGLYRFGSLRHRVSHLGGLSVVWIFAILTVVAIIYLAKSGLDFSRGWIVLWAGIGWIGLVGARLVAWAALARLRDDGRFAFNVAVVGEEQPAADLAHRIEERGQGDIRVLGIFRPKASCVDGTQPGYDLRDIDALIHLARQYRIDEIAICLPRAGEANLGVTLRNLCAVPVDVTLHLEMAQFEVFGVTNLRVSSMPLFRRPLAGWRIFVKRGIDFTLSAMILLVLGPLMLGIALAVKLDSPGPILFRQQRFGFNRQLINIYKFRTMYAEAALDPSVPQARRKDPRVTRVGRFLRRTSLDELPQLFNVLNGSMSLVGPRPHAVAHDERYAKLIDRYLSRYRVRPGITGWAQVNGLRGEIDVIEKMEQRVRHDLYYIEHWSPLFDIYILLVSLFVGFHHPNAY